LSRPLRIQYPGYGQLLGGITELLNAARRQSARSVNAILTATYWEVGRRIVEYEQGGQKRAKYGEQLLERLSEDLSRRIGKGFSLANLRLMRQFHVAYPQSPIRQTVSGELEARMKRPKLEVRSSQSLENSPTGSADLQEDRVSILLRAFPLPWSAYVCLLSVVNPMARDFYEKEALRGGWSVRQLDRQIASLFYERTALSLNKSAMLKKGEAIRPEEVSTPEEEIKDPFVLEFLGLRDQYSESELEEALIVHLEHFLLELGSDFAFIGRQRRLRIGDEWYRVDLLFFHRRLRCLVILDLKVGKFTHADAGQMHLYLNYAREHWTHPGENPPVGLILCAKKNNDVAKYALEGLTSKIMAAEYKVVLPDEKILVAELENTRKMLERRKA
jgi:predicted nuclease of restriction endonuclease-like (RecB) superfamily